uniref:EamA domain-containing protein n=1 Tax=Eiseniibacteriota bacterium TaxID=2212470 RepID=A0A832MMM8_UNCEI
MMRGRRGRVLLAFAAVYVIWGSTYLAIRWALVSFPPFTLAGVRFLIAGGVLTAWALARGAAPPAAVHWRSAAIVGGLMLFGGNAAVVWATQRAPSGLVAVLVAMVPFWMALLSSVGPRRVPLRWPTMAGVAIGMAGIALLVRPGSLSSPGGVDPAAAGVLALGSLSWASGSLLARRVPLPSAPLLAIGLEMLCGGALLAIAAAAAGEAPRVRWDALDARAVAALLYLVAFGSIVAFTAYIWLLGATTPARVSTYAFVNPVVAVALGWAFAGEPVTARTASASALVVAAVAIITLAPAGGPRRAAAGASGGGAAPDAP